MPTHCAGIGIGKKNMIRICICDDMSVQLCMTTDMVRLWCEKQNIDFDVQSFESGSKVISYVKENGSFDIYVLDMIMPGIRGIDLAEKLRALGDRGRIIYLTATSEYAVDSYRVGAFFYMLKPISQKGLDEVLDRAVSEIIREKFTDDSTQLSGQRISIKTRDGVVLVSAEDINYIDIVNRAPCYHLRNGKTLCGTMLRVPFQEAMEEYGFNAVFINAGLSLLVNPTAIVRLEKNSVTFSGGDVYFPSKSAFTAISNYVNRQA